jgi:hypothetical protein
MDELEANSTALFDEFLKDMYPCSPMSRIGTKKASISLARMLLISEKTEVRGLKESAAFLIAVVMKRNIFANIFIGTLFHLY